MARNIFYPSNDSYTLSATGEPQAGIQVKIFTRQSGGTQVTDLTYVGYDGSIGAAVTSGILTSDGNGLIPAFAGPDGGATTLWGNHGLQGERIALFAASTGGGGGGGAVSSVVGQTGDVTGTQILADTSVAAALTAKAATASPTLTGTPTAPTAASGTSTTQLATTAFVAAAVTTGTTSGTVAAGDDTRIVGAAQKSANLSDLASPSTARTNLGLGTAATSASTAFETAGAAATAQAAAVASSAQRASNLSDLASASTARTNLGLGSAATMTPTTIAADIALTGTYAQSPVATGVKTSAYTAVVSDLVPVDTTSGAVTITLPTAPADKSQVVVKHVIQGGTNAVTIQLGGSDVVNKAGGSTTFTLPLVNQGVILQYKASGAIWYAVADDIPLSGLDARHGPIVGSDNWLKLHAGGNLDALLTGAITRDGNGAATSAGVIWPDGTTGTYTATTVSTAFPGAVDALTVTYVGATTRTVTQSAVTRDTTGAVSNRPAMTVS